MKEVEGREGQRDQHVPDQEAQHHLAVHALGRRNTKKNGGGGEKTHARPKTGLGPPAERLE